MALKFTRKPSDYISETAYAYDVAQTSKYFDKSVYETLAETGNNEAIQQYLFGVAGAGDKTSEYFNEHDYKYLSNEDKANYTIWSLYVDRDETDVDDQTGETYNVWERQKEYFDYKVQEGIDKETYNSLNSFQKTMSSIGGVVGNALNETLLGTVEGLVDLGAVIVGQKDWAAKDFTGVGANRELLQKYSRAYTYLDKNKFWKVSNDVVTGLAQMAPLAIPYVGSFIYFGAMAGNTAADAVRINPDIDYLSLIGYTAAVTGVEYATEKLSAGIFGGSGTFIDNAIFKSSGKGLTKIGQKTMGNWVGRVGLNFLAEGFEESIAEFADTALFNVFIAQGDDALRKEYSIQDILYAGLIGGLIGGLGESGRIARTTRLGLTQDGQLISLQKAKQDKINIKQTLTKTQSLVAGEKISNAQRVLTKDALVDLKKKYSKLTLDEIKQQHSDEYNKALAKNTKTSQELTEVVLGLNRIYELAGDKGFQKAAELANATFDVSRRLAQNYVNRLGGTEQNKKINIKVQKKYGNNTSFKVKDVLTAEEIRLKNNMKTFYGIDVFFGDLGTLGGENKKFGVTISESEIIIDSNQMGKMSEQEILDKIVKEELVHTLQFTKGLITPKTLKVIHDELNKQGAETQQQSLESAYTQDTTLTKLTEAQAKAVAEVLLFDDLTINKMFRDDNKTFNGVYKVLNGVKNVIDKLKHFKTPKGKIKYNKVLKILKTYREAAARQFDSENELNDFVKKYQLSDADEKELREIYLIQPNVGKAVGAEQMAFSKTGESKLSKEAVDILYNEDGTPKTFYRGGNTPNIKVFDSSKGAKKRITNSSWFTDNLEVAKSYSNEKRETPTIYSVELSKITNPKIIDAKGLQWNQAFEGKTTDQIVEEAIAENKGYDAVIIKNVIDPGPYSTSRELLKPATDIAVIDTSKITITDESPRNRAATTKNEAYSKQEESNKKDNKNRNLSEEIAEKTKNSVVRDENGNLLTMYHGTSRGGFTQFDTYGGAYGLFGVGSYFTDNESIAVRYTRKGKGKTPMVYETYLNITNPINMDAPANPEQWKNVEPDVDFPTSGTNEDFWRAVEEDMIDQGDIPKYEAAERMYNDLLVMGYDGITHEGGGRVSKDGVRHRVYIALEPDQVFVLTKTPATDMAVIDLETAVQKVEQKFEKKAERKRRIKKTSEGVQLDVFEYIDEEVPVGERESTRLKAIEQEIPYNELKPTQKTIDKANKIKELCSELAQSEYQGDIENHKFAKLTSEIFEKGADLFGEITPDEWQTIRGILFMDLADPRASAALNAITRYAYLHRANQFASISDLVKTLYANAISSSGQLIGLSSHDYNNHSVQSFITELAMKHRVSEIPLDEKLILKTAPEFKTVEDFKKSLQDTINTLKQQAKGSKDAYTKWELNRQASSKERILTALNDGDVAVAIDEQLSNILESNENISENLQKQNETYKALIEWLLEHSEFENQSLKGFSDKKIPLSKNLDKAKKFFEGLESFRYMMMLSNPATAAKNAISNTLILGQSYIEDFGTKFFEKRNWLTEAQQASYTGEYNQDFSKWVDDNYLDKIKSDAEGDKYTSNELRRLQQQYAEAKDPIKQNKVLSTIQSLERRLLNDKFWVTRRTLQNLKNTLAGSSDLILSQARSWLVAKYKGNLDSKNITNEQLIDNISKTNKELSGLFTAAVNGDKVSIMKLAVKLNLDIVSPDLKQQSSIYYHSFYRANKMFFKVDNWFTRVMSNLNKSHPAMAYVVRHFIPFVRVTANATSYVIDRSPIGLLKGIYQAIQTKAKWQYQMKSNIDQYYRQQYSKIMSQNNIDFKFNQAEYNEWFDNTVDEKTKLAMSGDKKALLEVFNSMVENGLVNSGSIGSDNLYARAEVMEKLSQGAVGTALMTLGLLLGALTDAFEYDDDDEYLGPVVKIGDIKIGLGELSPFSTLFTMSAMLTSDKVDNKIEAAFNIFADATILSTLDSALSYSNGVWDYTKNQSINIISQYQPAITKALSKLIYNNKKDKSGSWGTKLLKTLGANSLIFNYLVPNKINPYSGKPEKYYDTGWFEGLFDIALPVGVRVDGRSDLEKEADSVGANTTGLSGKFTINNDDIVLTGKTKEKYAKYKAHYINNRFSKIHEGSEKVVIKDDKTGKFRTTTYDKLSKDEKRRVLNNLYSNATEITKIQYWLDKGNSYVVTDKDQYYEYKKLFGSSAKIVYKKSWSTSKFVEG